MSRRSSPSRPADRRPPRNHHGFHVLCDPAVVHGLVRSSGVGPGDLVFDLGAGPGAITLALARTGARVIAVERDPRLARRLTRRTDGLDVRVVEGDVRTVALPRRPFHVVGNLPFSTGTEVLRRLLDRRVPLVGADLVVEWGFARRASTERGVTIARRVPRSAFSPPPRVEAAHLVVRRPRSHGERPR